jgi:hypothetical protein
MNACQSVNSFQCGSLQLLCSELHFYGKQHRSEQFAWLAGPGIYHGHLNLGTSPSANHTHGGESNVESFDNASTAKPCCLW